MGGVIKGTKQIGVLTRGVPKGFPKKLVTTWKGLNYMGTNWKIQKKNWRHFLVVLVLNFWEIVVSHPHLHAT